MRNFSRKNRAVLRRWTENSNDENRCQVEVADPTGFNTSKANKVFSGPQPGEKHPPLQATGIRGGAKDVTCDLIAGADGRLHVLLLQDESGVGLSGLYDIAGVR